MARQTPTTGNAAGTRTDARADNKRTLKTLDSQCKGPTLPAAGVCEKTPGLDHARIAEQAAPVLEAAAQGYFQLYEPLAELTEAHFLNDPTRKIPVFVHFFAGPGPAGSADALRGVCGFAVRFYTGQGNFDLIGSNIAVAFTRDAVALGDVIQAFERQAYQPLSSGQSLRDCFWDYVSSTPETAHGVLWLMSDRALPASYRAMQGFSVHSLRLLNAERKSAWVKFHWRPLTGVFSLVWDEAQKLAAKIPDFKRRALWRDIERSCYPEWELGIQVIAEEDAANYGFDLCDPTKLISEELVPLRKVGKLRLNRKPDGAFAEAEQATLHGGNTVPGIDSNLAPCLPGRRLSPGAVQALPADGLHADETPPRRPIAALPNVRAESCQHRAFDRQWSKPTVSAIKPRPLGECFIQASLFWNSLSRHEKDHIVSAYSVELSSVDKLPVRRRQVHAILANIDMTLATRVALNIGVAPPAGPAVTPRPTTLLASPALSQVNLLSGTIGARTVAILIADGLDAKDVEFIRCALRREGASGVLIGLTGAPVTAADGTVLLPDASLAAMPSILFDGLFIPGGAASSLCLSHNGDALYYLLEAYKHLKAIALCASAGDLARELTLEADEGLLCGNTEDVLANAFMAAIAKHRIWAREAAARSIPV